MEHVQAARLWLLQNFEDPFLPMGLHELEELPYKEIASVLSVPEGTVMSRLSRARLKFKELLKEGSK